MIDEIIKCRKDPIYFIENYCKILHPKYGIITPKLYPKQKELINLIINEPFIIVLKSRQVGVSTIYALIFAWMLIFIPNYRIGVISRDKFEAGIFAERVERAILSVPQEFWIDFKENNKLSKTLANGSEIIISAPVKHALRGETLNYVFLDEVLAMNFIDYIYSSVFYTIQHNFINLSSAQKRTNIPCGLSLISTGALIDYNSPQSCRGAIWFKQKWNEALTNTGEIRFKTLKIHWSETGFFDKEWYKTQCENLNNDEILIRTELECEFIEINLKDSASNILSEIKQLKFPNLRDFNHSKKYI